MEKYVNAADHVIRIKPLIASIPAKKRNASVGKTSPTPRDEYVVAEKIYICRKDDHIQFSIQ